MKEVVMVCVNHPMHAQRLIGRGIQIARAFGGECLVLNVHPRPYDEWDFDELHTMHLFRGFADKNGLRLVERLSGARPVAEVIAEVVREESVTQLVLGQSAKNRIESMLHEPLVNQLLKRHTGVDLHIVEVTRVAWAEPELEKGHAAWLVEEEGGLRLRLDKPHHPVAEGVFFKWATTEFDDGFFVPAKSERVRVLAVTDGLVSAEDWRRASTMQ